MPTRLTRAQQVERNRAQVLGAAKRVFLARGYAGASVDAIAEEAGFSKGVVYSQFGGKPDLFLALLDERITERSLEHRAWAAEHAGLDGLRALLQASARSTSEARGWGQLVLEFRLVAARDPELNQRYVALHRRSLEGLAWAVGTVLDKDGLTTDRPLAEIAEIMFYLDVGRRFEQAAGTAVLDDDAIDDVITRFVTPRRAAV